MEGHTPRRMPQLSLPSLLILARLSKGPATAWQLSQELGIPLHYVYAKLERLRFWGLIVRTGGRRGVYEATKEGHNIIERLRVILCGGN